jgi:nitroreductase
MNTKPEPNEYVPTALRQVWEWKDAIYQETKHLPTREALREILRQAHEASLAHGFVTSQPVKLAETPPGYGRKD